MPNAMAAPEVLDREFLVARAKILELAAFFDRLDRGDGSVDGDSRIKQLHEALELLQRQQGDRAEEAQLVFSRAYEDDWQETFDLRSPSTP